MRFLKGILGLILIFATVLQSDVALFGDTSPQKVSGGVRISGHIKLHPAAAAAQVCGPPSYSCSDSTAMVIADPQPPASLVGSVGAGAVGYDTTFPENTNLNPVIRITDQNTVCGQARQSMLVTPSGGAGDVIWNNDDHLLAITGQADATNCVVAFDPVNLSVGKVSAKVNGLGAFAFSHTDPLTAYVIKNATGHAILYRIQFASETDPTVFTTTQVVQFDGTASSPCFALRGVTAAAPGPLRTSHDDSLVATNLWAGAQNTAPSWAVAYYVSGPNAGKCTTLEPDNGIFTDVNGSTSTMTAPGRFPLHASAMFGDGLWMNLSNGCDDTGHLNVCPDGQRKSPYIWQINTNNVSTCQPDYTHCSGHDAHGFSHWYLYGDPGWLSRSATDSFVGFTQFFTNPGTLLQDAHFAPPASDITDTYPAIASTMADGNSPFPFGNPIMNEIIAVFPDATYKAGRSYVRFTHNWDTTPSVGTCSGKTTDFRTVNAIGSTSQTGKFFAWTTDMRCQLGLDANNLPRGDVYVVGLGFQVGGGGGNLPVTIWFGPNGNDANTGIDALHEVATAQKAASLASGHPDAIIYADWDGVYSGVGTLVLTSTESGTSGHPIIWQPAPGRSPIFAPGALSLGVGSGYSWAGPGANGDYTVSLCYQSCTASVVTLFPSGPYAIEQGTTVPFSAQISGTTSNAGVWDVDGITGGNATVGTIDTAGNYTAPTSNGSHNIRFTSTATSASKIATVTVSGTIPTNTCAFSTGINNCTMSHDGITRTVWVYVPSGYVAGQSGAIVNFSSNDTPGSTMCGGLLAGNGSGQETRYWTVDNPVGQGYIDRVSGPQPMLICPDAMFYKTQSTNQYFRRWNGYQENPNNFYTDASGTALVVPNDSDLALQFVRLAIKQKQVNPHKIWVDGLWHNGSSMVLRFAIEHPEYVAAFDEFELNPPLRNLDVGGAQFPLPTGPASMLLIKGTNSADPYKVCGSTGTVGWPGDLNPESTVDDEINYWLPAIGNPTLSTAQNFCTGGGGSSFTGLLEKHSTAGTLGSVIQAYTLVPGSNVTYCSGSWGSGCSGGPINLSCTTGTQNNPCNSTLPNPTYENDIIWNFFNAHPRPSSYATGGAGGLPVTQVANFEALFVGAVGTDPVRRFKTLTTNNTYKANAGSVCSATVTASCPSLANGANGCPSGQYACGDEFKFSGTDVPAAFQNLAIDDIEVLNFEKWTMSRGRLKQVDAANHIAYLTASEFNSQTFPSFAGFIPAHHYLIEGCLPGTDATCMTPVQAEVDGRWTLVRDSNSDGVLDNTWTLHYWPKSGENPNNMLVYVPQTSMFITGTGAHDITFKGFHFSYDNMTVSANGFSPEAHNANIPASISFTNGSNITFMSDTFSHTMNFAVEFVGSASPGIGNYVINNAFFDLGTGAVRLGQLACGTTNARGVICPNGTDTQQNVSQNNTVTGNVLRGGQRFIAGGIGLAIWLGNTHDNVVWNNTIDDWYNGAIAVGVTLNNPSTQGTSFASNNNFQFNKITNIGKGVTSDMGCIHTENSNTTGNVFSNNYCADVTHDTTVTTGPSPGYGGQGIYFDQGSGGWTAANNMVLRCSETPLDFNNPLNATNNTITNNIFAYGRLGMVRRVDDMAPGVLTATVTNNIFYFDRGNTTDNSWQFKTGRSNWWKNGQPALTGVMNMQSNLYFSTTQNLATATHFAYSTDGSTSAFNPTYVTFAGWQALGEDVASVITDPLFVGPSFAQGDNYTFASSAAYSQIGFVPFDYTLAGSHSVTPPVPASIPDAFPVNLLNQNTAF